MGAVAGRGGFWVSLALQLVKFSVAVCIVEKRHDYPERDDIINIWTRYVVRAENTDFCGMVSTTRAWWPQSATVLLSLSVGRIMYLTILSCMILELSRSQAATG